MMTRTSHKRNRPFDFKLIDLVEPHSVLYKRQAGLSTYATMKLKTQLWTEIAAEMSTTVEFCIMRWGNLRGQYQKELRQCRELCPRRGLIRGSTWPYLQRLQFLESTVQFNKPQRISTYKRKRKGSSKTAAKEINDYAPTQQPVMDALAIENEHLSILAEIKEETQSASKEYSSSVSAAAEEQNSTRIQRLLLSFEGETRQRVERRLLAFLCKCQLRELSNQGVGDLVI